MFWLLLVCIIVASMVLGAALSVLVMESRHRCLPHDPNRCTETKVIG